MTSIFSFNPRAHAGRDTDHRRVILVKGFQSTRPRRARPEIDAIDAKILSFNPRAHAGRDGKTD